MTGEKGRAAALTELSLVMAAVFWGSNYAATKYAASHLPQLSIVAFRLLVGGLLLFLVMRLLEPGNTLGKRDVLPMATLGCLGVAVSQTSFTYGVSMTSTANTGLVFATAPVWGLLLGFALGLERPTRWGLLGVGLSILGVGVVFREGLVGAEDASLLGDLLVLVAAVTVGAYTVFSMRMLERHSPFAVATYPMLFGAPLVLLLASPDLAGLDWPSVDGGAWAAVGFSVVFATAFAFAAWQRGISRIGANRVLVYQYLITLTGVVSGIILFGERLGVDKILGGAIILLGVYLARR
ncbi:MAG TPA: DMT family transporter [Rubrobacteraceae bacterium]|nr:DMT family transporter [Rubrobacteraceae bacterium]